MVGFGRWFPTGDSVMHQIAGNRSGLEFLATAGVVDQDESLSDALG